LAKKLCSLALKSANVACTSSGCTSVGNTVDANRQLIQPHRPQAACCTQGIVEQYRGSSILEVQARSCEYSHMFKLDGMRAALLEHIPPLDESTYTRNLGNSQVIDGAAAAQVTSPLLCSACTAAAATHLMRAIHLLSCAVSQSNQEPARGAAAGCKNRHREHSRPHHCCCQAPLRHIIQTTPNLAGKIACRLCSCHV